MAINHILLQEEKRPETILESLIKRPATVPKVEMVEEPTDWKPSDKCYFCVEGEGGGETRPTEAQVSKPIRIVLQCFLT